MVASVLVEPDVAACAEKVDSSVVELLVVSDVCAFVLVVMAYTPADPATIAAASERATYFFIWFFILIILSVWYFLLLRLL